MDHSAGFARTPWRSFLYVVLPVMPLICDRFYIDWNNKGHPKRGLHNKIVVYILKSTIPLHHVIRQRKSHRSRAKSPTRVISGVDTRHRNPCSSHYRLGKIRHTNNSPSSAVHIYLYRCSLNLDQGETAKLLE